MDALYSLSLVTVRDMLARGEVSPSRVLDACLERIRATEPAVRATLSLMEDDARETARVLESSGPDANKPLWGVPLMLKDNINTKGHPTTCASKMLENCRPVFDAAVVEKLRAAGAVLLGKTNMDEFAMGGDTGNSAFHPTNNPWDTDRVPGGSSGGSAASVAAMQCYGALGSDSGGSIRQPASFCGCVGLKPTYGRVSRYGVAAYASSMDQVGPMAGTVEDTALLYQVIAGHDPRDAMSAPLPLDDAFAALSATGDLKGVRIGVPEEFWQGNSVDVDTCCRAALDAAVSLGATLVPLSLSHARHGVAVYCILSTAEAGTNMARFDGVRFGLRDADAADLSALYAGSRSRGFGEEVKRRILLGTFVLSSGYYEAYYKKAAQVRRLIREDYEKAFTVCDVLAAPSAPVTAWVKGRFSGDPLAAYQMDILTVGANLAGLPALSFPAGLGAESKMPVGLQFYGPAFGEKAILTAAKVLSKALPPLGAPRGL